MSKDIAIIFPCTSDRINVNRVGTDVTLMIDANLFNPPDLKVSKVRKRTNRLTRHRTTVKGRQRVGSIGTPRITEAELPYWLELYDSVSADEIFTVDALTNSPGGTYPGIYSALQVFIPDDTFSTPRVGVQSKYTTLFNFEVVG